MALLRLAILNQRMGEALKESETTVPANEFEALRHRSFDNMAGEILNSFGRRRASLSLEECRTLFAMVQQIINETACADLVDIQYVTALAVFLEADKKDGAGRSLRALVNRFGSEAAKAQFISNRVSTREESRMGMEAREGSALEKEKPGGLIDQLQDTLKSLAKRFIEL